MSQIGSFPQVGVKIQKKTMETTTLKTWPFFSNLVTSTLGFGQAGQTGTDHLHLLPSPGLAQWGFPVKVFEPLDVFFFSSLHGTNILPAWGIFGNSSSKSTS